MRTISNLENARDDFSLAANKKDAHHTLRFTQHAPPHLASWEQFNACAASLPDPHVRASDRMSRSELTLLSRSYPTASQVMTTESKEAIVEGQNLNLHSVRCKWAGWAACVANDMGHCQWVVMRVLFCFLCQ